MDIFLTTHNTDFTELRGWQAQDGIWSSRDAALGGMRAGAYQPGQGVDVRRISTDPRIFDRKNIETTTVVGQFSDTFGDSRIGYVPENRIRATAEQKAEFRALESALGRLLAVENRNVWLADLANAQAAHRDSEPSTETVWLTFTHVTRSIGSYTYPAHIITAVFTDRTLLDEAVARRRDRFPDAEPAVFAEVALNSSFDLEALAKSATKHIEPVSEDAKVAEAQGRYADLIAELGL